MKRKITGERIQGRQVMQMKTIAHHQPTDAQPVTEQQPPTAFPLVLLLSTTP